MNPKLNLVKKMPDEKTSGVQVPGIAVSEKQKSIQAMSPIKLIGGTAAITLVITTVISVGTIGLLNAFNVIDGSNIGERVSVLETRHEDTTELKNRVHVLETRLERAQQQIEDDRAELAVMRAVFITAFGNETTNAILNGVLPTNNQARQAAER